MLVDSSVWIPYLRGERAAGVPELLAALKRGGAVWLAAPILQEVLQGADSEARFARWDRILGELPLLADPDLRSSARRSALLYARCRWLGITPRSANDCLIAVSAVSHGVPLLHNDRDFVSIARVEPRLALVPTQAP
jgi:predicted nucleic acid-binding protein